MRTLTRRIAPLTTAIKAPPSAIKQLSGATCAPAYVKDSPARTTAVRKKTSAANPHATGWPRCSTARLPPTTAKPPPRTAKPPRTTAKRHATKPHRNNFRVTQTAPILTPTNPPTSKGDCAADGPTYGPSRPRLPATGAGVNVAARADLIGRAQGPKRRPAVASRSTRIVSCWVPISSKSGPLEPAQALARIVVGTDVGGAVVPAPADLDAHAGVVLDVLDVVGAITVLGDDPERVAA